MVWKGAIGHTFGVRVDGASPRRFLRFLSLTAFQAEGCGGGFAASKKGGAADAAGCIEGLCTLRSGGDSPDGLRVVVAASPQFYSAAFQSAPFHRFAVPLCPVGKHPTCTHSWKTQGWARFPVPRNKAIKKQPEGCFLMLFIGWKLLLFLKHPGPSYSRSGASG